MDILVRYWDGRYCSYNARSINRDYSKGYLRIVIDEYGVLYYIDENDIKEIVYVTDYTRSYAVEHGFEKC